MNPVYNPKLQLLIMHMYIKFQASSFIVPEKTLTKVLK